MSRIKDYAEKKIKIFNRYYGKCYRCGKQAVFLAHRIAKTKNNKWMMGEFICRYLSYELSEKNVKKYGEIGIHHELNLLPVCMHPACNDAANIGFKTEQAKKLMEQIANDIAWAITQEEICR